MGARKTKACVMTNPFAISHASIAGGGGATKTFRSALYAGVTPRLEVDRHDHTMW
jgi:hypothetical protein